MRRAELKDRKLVCDILTESFGDNPSVIYATKADGRRSDAVYALMAYSFSVCFHAGVIWINDAENVCLLAKLPGRKVGFIRQTALDMKLLLRGVGLAKAARVLRRQKMIRQCYRHSEYIYLWYIGVARAAQGNGHGSALMDAFLAEVAPLRLPVYLETSVVRNLSWYQDGFGFRHVATIPFDAPLYVFIREPRERNPSGTE